MVSSKVIGGRYRIENPPIGQGGMGVVHKAFDSVLKKFVAIKTVKNGVDHESLQLFEREWTILTRLCHPNIIDILDIGEFTEDGQTKPYFVMPLLPGTTLERLIKTAGQRLTPERIVEIICQACKGLQAAHDQGLVHRDLKPSNLFVLDDDTVKIIDFGVAHLTGHDTRTGLKGTLQYMAPEQVEMQPATAKSDIFSLGVVCYEGLTGRKPFDRSTPDDVIQAIRTYVPPPAGEISPSVNEQVSRSVHRALAKLPYHRYASAKEFADVLRRSLRNEHIEFFDSQRIRPRINRVKKALTEGDYQFATELLSELEAEGNIDAELSMLRIQVEQAIRARTIHQLLEGARARIDEEEYVLAAQKVQSVLDLDATNIDALALKGSIERKRSASQIDKWLQIARQHLDNRLFQKARQAAEEILKIDRANVHALDVLGEIAHEEQKAAKLRQERQQLYDSAMQAYRDGDISSALTKLERVIELGKQSPGQPHTDAQYLAFYDQIRSERDDLNKTYADGKKALETRDFGRAFEICRDVLRRRPGDPMFQSLKIEIEDGQRQENSAAVAEFHTRIEAEPDLERKYALVKDAVNRFPNEQAFVQLLKLTRERRDLVNSIVGRARHYESQGQFLEASNQWDILRNIYGQYPGLEHELRRLHRRQEAHVQDEAKTSWVEKIDQAMVLGEYESACELTDAALEEFPGEGELVRLKEQSDRAAERGRRARLLLAEGQRLAAAGHYLGAIEKLRGAWDLDEKNVAVVSSLTATLTDYARTLAERDWQAARPFIDEALEISPGDPDAVNVSLLIEDAKRRQSIERCVMEGRELQTAGKLHDALAKVDEGLCEYPNETRLTRLRATLSSAIESQRGETIRRAEPARGSAATHWSVAAAAGGGTSTPVANESPPVAASAEPLSAPYMPNESLRDDERVRIADQHIPPSTPISRHRTRLPERRSLRTKIGVAAAIVIAIVIAVLISKNGTLLPASAAGNRPGQAGAAAVSANSGAQDGVKGLAGARPELVKEASGDSRAKVLDAQQEKQIKAPALFHFESTPSPAKVIVDEDPNLTCQTPCYLPLAPGRHTYVVSAHGYFQSKRIVQVPSETSSFVSLSEDIQTVQISSNPAASTIFIDGDMKGQTPLTLHLSVGQHKIRLEKDDLRYEDDLEVKSGDFQHFFITLGRKQTP